MKTLSLISIMILILSTLSCELFCYCIEDEEPYKIIHDFDIIENFIVSAETRTELKLNTDNYDECLDYPYYSLIIYTINPPDELIFKYHIKKLAFEPAHIKVENNVVIVYGETNINIYSSPIYGKPKLLTSIEVPHIVCDVSLNDDKIVVFARKGEVSEYSIYIYENGDTTNTEIITSFDFPTEIGRDQIPTLILYNNYLFVSYYNLNGNIRIYDLTIPDAPQLITTVENIVDDRISLDFIQEDKLYFHNESLSVNYFKLDISDIINPQLQDTNTNIIGDLKCFTDEFIYTIFDSSMLKIPINASSGHEV